MFLDKKTVQKIISALKETIVSFLIINLDNKGSADRVGLKDFGVFRLVVAKKKDVFVNLKHPVNKDHCKDRYAIKFKPSQRLRALLGEIPINSQTPPQPINSHIEPIKRLKRKI